MTDQVKPKYVYCIHDGRYYKTNQNTYVPLYNIGISDMDSFYANKQSFIENKLKCLFILKTSNNILVKQWFHRQLKEERISKQCEWFGVKEEDERIQALLEEHLHRHPQDKLIHYNPKINTNTYPNIRKKTISLTNNSPTNHCQKHTLMRYQIILNLIGLYPTITIEQLLALYPTYKLIDLHYDVHKRNLLQIGNKVSCEGCGSTKDVELLCLHHYFCVECAGGTRFHCSKCNPKGKLYTIQDNKKKIPTIQYH